MKICVAIKNDNVDFRAAGRNCVNYKMQITKGRASQSHFCENGTLSPCTRKSKGLTLKC